MKSDRQTQIDFFDWIKNQYQEQSLVNSLCDILKISTDSAYRRIRGDTLLSFNEIGQISRHYNVSLDTYLRLTTSSVVFHNRSIDERFTFEKYLASLVDNLEMVLLGKEHSITYLAKDIPIFHFFNFPSLTKFKFFFWQKIILSVNKFKSENYSADLIGDELINNATSILKHFQKIPSVEIWSDETVNVTISQINYAYDSGFLDQKKAIQIVQEFEELIAHIKQQTELGHKYKHGTDPGVSTDSGKLSLYYNEVEIGDNTILFKMNGQRLVFKTFNMLNTLSTSDPNFCDQIEMHIDTIIKKSLPVSLTSEKERAKFFNRMTAKVIKLKHTLAEMDSIN